SVALACLVLGSIAMAQQPSAPDVAAAGIRETSKLPSAVALKMAMHKLWEDHITYTRNYILSAVAGLPDTESVAKRLLQNQNEIGTAIMPYYGEPAGQKLSALLGIISLFPPRLFRQRRAGPSERWAPGEPRCRPMARNMVAF